MIVDKDGFGVFGWTPDRILMKTFVEVAMVPADGKDVVVKKDQVVPRWTSLLPGLVDLCKRGLPLKSSRKDDG